MHEDHRSEHARHDVAPVNQLVEIVQLACVVKGAENKSNQAENIEVLCFLRAATPEINEQPNCEVGYANKVQVVYGGVTRHFAHNERRLNINALVPHQVVALAPCTQSHKDFGHVQRVRDQSAVDTDQEVARPDSCFRGWTAFGYVQCYH